MALGGRQFQMPRFSPAWDWDVAIHGRLHVAGAMVVAEEAQPDLTNAWFYSLPAVIPSYRQRPAAPTARWPLAGSRAGRRPFCL